MQFDSPTNNLVATADAFQRLREQTHRSMENSVAKRMKNNPTPTQEELYVGAFREMIEPQVCDALFEFNRKGYVTESSGFGGENGEIQFMDGYFEIDPKTKIALQLMGVEVLKDRDLGWPGGGKRDGYTYVRFYLSNPILKELKATWDTIAATLPDLMTPLQPSVSGGSEDFRKQFASDRTGVERQSLERALVTGDFEPTAERKMRDRIATLAKRK